MSRMIRVNPFDVADLDGMDVQDAQADDLDSLIVLAAGQAAAGQAFTIRCAETNRVLMCAGAMHVHDDYAALWAIMAKDLQRHMLVLTRRTREFIDALPYKRVDATLDATFEPGLAWAALLGLTLEARLASLLPGGKDAMIYRRIR